MSAARIRNMIYLLICSIVWGISFVPQAASMEFIGPFTFNAVRCALGSLVLIPVILIARYLAARQQNVTEDESLSVYLHVFDRSTVTGGILSGVLLFIATNLQTIALKTASAGKGGFITAMYIILVPILGIFIHKKIHLNVWISVGLAAVGLYLLCIRERMTLKPEDMLLLACAFFFAIQILTVDKYVPTANGIAMAAIEFGVCSILSAVVMAFAENPSWVTIGQCKGAIIYAGACSCGIAYTLQILGQRDVDPTLASLIMSLESVTSVIAGAIILHQFMTGREILGCALMFVAIILAQMTDLIYAGRRRKNEQITPGCPG